MGNILTEVILTAKEELDQALNKANNVIPQLIDDIDKKLEETKELVDGAGAASKQEVEEVASQLEETKTEVVRKVDKVEGETLTPNKYTNDDKNKVDTIPNLAPKTYVDTKVATISSGTPLFASSVSGMTDKTKNYVNTTDGYLYTHNGTIFVKSTVKYQEMGLSDNQVTVEKTDFAEKVEVGTTDVVLNDLFTIVGSLSPTNGNLNTGNTAYRSTDFIDASNSDFCFRYVLDGLISSKFTDFVCIWSDENKTYVSGTNQGTNYTVEQYNGKFGVKYNKPLNAKWVRFSCNVANCVGGSGNLYTYLKVESTYDTKLSGTYYENYIEEKINNSPTSSKPWQGKNVGVFSDSIWGNFRDETGIASIVAKNTGATVYNFGLGGTRMSGRNDSNSQAQYWDKFSFCRIVDYIEAKDFTPMRNALSNMSSALSYFGEVIAMLENIDFTKIHILFIAYGTNDFTGQNVVYDNENPNNLYSYNNAYRYAIEKLLTLYPHLRIIIVTPAWRFWDDNGIYLYDSDTHVIGNQKLYDFVECAEKVAKDIHTPVINIYDLLGANKYTRSQYFNDTDGTHHNPNGRVRYGSLVSHKAVTLI